MPSQQFSPHRDVLVCLAFVMVFLCASLVGCGSRCDSPANPHFDAPFYIAERGSACGEGRLLSREDCEQLRPQHGLAKNYAYSDAVSNQQPNGCSFDYTAPLDEQDCYSRNGVVFQSDSSVGPNATSELYQPICKRCEDLDAEACRRLDPATCTWSQGKCKGQTYCSCSSPWRVVASGCTEDFEEKCAGPSDKALAMQRAGDFFFVQTVNTACPLDHLGSLEACQAAALAMNASSPDSYPTDFAPLGCSLLADGSGPIWNVIDYRHCDPDLTLYDSAPICVNCTTLKTPELCESSSYGSCVWRSSAQTCQGRPHCVCSNPFYMPAEECQDLGEKCGSVSELGRKLQQAAVGALEGYAYGTRCPAGKFTTEIACKDAATALGKAFHSKDDDEGVPFGCWLSRWDLSINYNSNKSLMNTSLQYASPICSRNASSLHISLQV